MSKAKRTRRDVVLGWGVSVVLAFTGGVLVGRYVWLAGGGPGVVDGGGEPAADGDGAVSPPVAMSPAAAARELDRHLQAVTLLEARPGAGLDAWRGRLGSLGTVNQLVLKRGRKLRNLPLWSRFVSRVPGLSTIDGVIELADVVTGDTAAALVALDELDAAAEAVASQRARTMLEPSEASVAALLAEVDALRGPVGVLREKTALLEERMTQMASLVETVDGALRGIDAPGLTAAAAGAADRSTRPMVRELGEALEAVSAARAGLDADGDRVRATRVLLESRGWGAEPAGVALE